MKNLKTLFNCGIDLIISGVKINSKEVTKGDLFLARMGINSDGHEFIDEAINNGAVALIVSKDVNSNVPIIKVNNVNEVIADIMDWYYGNPNTYFKNIIGVTGTAGKTTVCNLINNILNYKGDSGLIGTNGIISKKYNIDEFEVLNTTVSIDKLYSISNIFRNNNIPNFVIETSSYGLKYNRLGNIKLDVGIITNFSEAHINDYISKEEYLESKLMIIKKIKESGILILNYDDPYYQIFKSKSNCKTYTFGSNKNTDLYFTDVNESLDKTEFKILYNNKIYNIHTRLLGISNIYNICAAILACVQIGIGIEDCIEALKDFYMVGRMQNYKNVILDFAVTVEALKKDMEFLYRNKKSKIISVISRIEGASSREYEAFSKISTKYSDYVIFTTDRNKSGHSEALKQFKSNALLNNYEIIIDRAEAIKRAINLLKKDDILYIVGIESFYKNKKEEYVDPFQLIDKHLNFNNCSIKKDDSVKGFMENY